MSEQAFNTAPLQRFRSDDVEIAYRDIGDGPPIVLVHGFASNHENNWGEPGWIDTLLDDGRRVIALDCRGHGQSEKPHDPDAYEGGAMTEDVIRLMDYLDVPEADLMGYSMGGGISIRLLIEHPDRFNAVIPSGIGDSMFDTDRDRSGIVEAFEADDPDEITDPVGRAFREFAESQGNDLEALAALQKRSRSRVEKADLGEVDLPVLVATGGDDERVGDPRPVADAIPTGEAFVIPGEDHLSAVSDPRYKDAVLDFLDREGL